MARLEQDESCWRALRANLGKQAKMKCEHFNTGTNIGRGITPTIFDSDHAFQFISIQYDP